MKRILFILLCSSTLSLSAQFAGGYIDLKSGMSIPVFDYSANNLETGSFTSPGLTASVEAGLLIYKKWGFVVQSGLQLHGVDASVLGWEKMMADPFLKNMYIRSEPYRVIHIAAGPEYAFHLIEKLDMDVKLLGGVFFTRTPYQLYKPVYFQTGPPYYEITSARDISFAYGGGLRVRYAITSCYELALEGEFLSSKAAFGFQTSNGLRTDYKTISMVNVSVGLLLHLF